MLAGDDHDDIQNSDKRKKDTLGADNEYMWMTHCAYTEEKA